MNEESTLKLVEKVIKAQDKFNKSFEKIAKDTSENIRILDTAVRLIESQKKNWWEKNAPWISLLANLLTPIITLLVLFCLARWLLNSTNVQSFSISPSGTIDITKECIDVK